MSRLALSMFLALACVSASSPVFGQSNAASPTQAQPVPAQVAPAASQTGAQTVVATDKAAPADNGPTDAKAKQTFADAQKLFKAHQYIFALEGFRKADKQDGGHCVSCEVQAFKAAEECNDFKAAREQAALLGDHLQGPAAKAQAHYLAGKACISEGVYNGREKPFEAADGEFQAALQLQPGKSDCLYSDGLALSHMKKDGEARERFQQYLKLAPSTDLDYKRAERFAEHPELARAKVAPNFQLTSSDGRTVTLESLTGKVVLIDFWATWCGPCREALPHVKKIAKRFAGPQFQVISISLDRDDAKWREFIAQNEMTWIQYRDGSFEGPVAKTFGVSAIPATFTIDADGILQDQHVGDADIEGKLKKLIARAQEVASKKTVAEVR